MSTALKRDVIVAGLEELLDYRRRWRLPGMGPRSHCLKRRPYIGGRAYSYHHPALAETIDSQHVVLGCCTNLLDLCARAGMAENLRWYDELTFIEANGRRSVMRSSGLPAPGHQALSFLAAPMLGLRDKAAIATGLLRFLRGVPADDAESFAAWLKRTGQTDRAIRHFWEPVVVGALNDDFENCSVKYAGKVFQRVLFALTGGWAAWYPRCPVERILFAGCESGAAARCRCSPEVRCGQHGANSGWPLVRALRRSDFQCRCGCFGY